MPGINMGLWSNTAALSGGGGGAWAPTSLGAGLAGWWEPKPANLTKAGGGTVVDGDAVNGMTDLSGNSLSFAQGNAADRPVYHTDGTHHWLTFDGVSDIMTVTSGTVTDGSGQHSSFSVVKPTSVAAGVQGILGADPGSGTRIAHFHRINGSVADSVALDTAVTGYTDTGATVTTASAQTIAEVTSTTAIECFVDNVSGGSTAISTALKTGATEAELGSFVGAYFGGNWYGSFIYKGLMSSGDRSSAQTYMRALAP
jgi:hypothetical protein